MALIAIGISCGNVSNASPLSTEPLVGLSTDYSTNPDLRTSDQKSEFHGALMLDLPVHYDRDNLHLALLPTGRYSNTKGYSSLASNFFRVDASASDVSETGSIVLNGGFSRDSSLYHGVEANQGVGVRRDTSTAGASLQHSVTERIQTGLDVNWMRTRYDDSPGSVTGLVSYRYVNAAAQLAYEAGERTNLSLQASAGRYNSLDKTTLSRDSNLEFGIARDLTEIWNMSAKYGYSKSKNDLDVYFGPFFLGTLESTQRGSVYSAVVSRKGETFTFTGTVSRELKPTGFAFLSRQQSLAAQFSYRYSERWQFNGDVSWRKSTDPLVQGGEVSRRNLYGQVSAVWNWRQDWMVTLRATRFDQHFDASKSLYAAANGVSLELSHQFDRTDLN